MKKFTMFCALAVTLSVFSVGCSSDGSSSWCRSGSLFPTSRSNKKVEQVYTTSVDGDCNPCVEVQPMCDPCTPIGPCDMSCTGGVISGGITPHPAGM